MAPRAAARPPQLTAPPISTPSRPHFDPISTLSRPYLEQELSKLGLEATSLSDALFPASTRAIKRLPKSKQAERAKAAKQAKAAGGGGDSEGDSVRRAAINSALRSGASQLLVADVAATRGLHFDAVSCGHTLPPILEPHHPVPSWGHTFPYPAATPP